MTENRRERVTSDDLLQAGWELIQEELGWWSNPEEAPEIAEDTPQILGGISARSVTSRRNVTTGAFYRRWSDRRTYVAELTAYILDKERHEQEYLKRALTAFDDAIASGQALPTVVRTVAGVDLKATAESVAFAVQMHFWTLCRRHPYLKGLLRRQYAEIDSAWQLKYSTVMGLLGWKLRPGLTMAGVSAMITALADGIAIRNVIDPAVATEQLLAEGIMAIIVSAVDWDGRAQTLDDEFSSLSNRGGNPRAP